MGIIWILLMVISIGMMMFADPAGILSAMTASVNESLFAVRQDVRRLLRVVGLHKNYGGNKRFEGCGQFVPSAYRKAVRQRESQSKGLSCRKHKRQLIGVANAATPTAIKAIDEMDKGDVKMTRGMAMLFVINSTGIELLPSTVMSMRAAAGSVSPADILLPSFIVNVVTTALGILLVCLLYKKDADKRASKSGELNVSTPLKGRRA